MNSHRAGVIRDGNTHMIASGSEEFCRTAVLNHSSKHNRLASEYVIVENEQSDGGKPKGWL